MAFHRILVALDHTPQAKAIFEHSFDIAQAFGAELKLLHCVQTLEETLATENIGAGASWPASTWPVLGSVGLPQHPSLTAQTQETWNHKLETSRNWLQSFAQQGQYISVECVAGRPTHQICERAKTWGADLIVMGRKGRTGLEEAFLGSVSNHVVHHAPCSVMTVQHVDNP